VLSNGTPLIVPLGFQFADGAFWCACSEQAKIVALVERQSHCGFDVSDNTMPYRGVRGQGQVHLSKDDGEPVLRGLIDRYLPTNTSPFANWLLARSHTEMAIVIRPDWLTAWDFSERMSTI
jgi:nitroimidazol reductase NimA-like FMN-containing flavoprotein (pyridoxamine 5'-phosphate oxidase superfamily)